MVREDFSPWSVLRPFTAESATLVPYRRYFSAIRGERAAASHIMNRHMDTPHLAQERKSTPMTLHATSAFTITSWEPTPIDDRDGVSLTRTKVTKTFTGDLEGPSVAELLMAGAPHESAAYVGFERVEGQLNRRAGSFILHHNATSARGEQSASWTIMADSGTGELQGISGAAQIVIEPDGGHTFLLDYDISNPGAVSSGASDSSR
jgi:Protein of unknown function (DUF3224)